MHSESKKAISGKQLCLIWAKAQPKIGNACLKDPGVGNYFRRPIEQELWHLITYIDKKISTTKSPIFLRGEETEKVTALTKFERPYRTEYSPQAYIYITTL